MLRAMGLTLAGLVTVAALGLGGCGASVIQPGLAVRPDANLADAVSNRVPPTRMHVVGVTGPEKKAYWESVNVTEHFEKVKPSDAAAQGIREFDLQKDVVRIPRDDAAWEAWGKPQYLVVLVNLRDKVNEGGKANDPRRLVLSLNAKRWAKLEGEIVLDVTRDQIVVRSEQTPVPAGEF